MVLFYCHDHYEGFIKAKGRVYFMKAFIENDQKWLPSDLIIDWRLLTFLGDKLHHFIDENHKNTSFSDFFNKLEKFLQSSLGEYRQSNIWVENPLKAHDLYKYLEHELQGISEFIEGFNFEDGIITIRSTDPAQRVHKAMLKINENYPMESLKIMSHNLPLEGGNFLQTNVDLQSSTTISSFCRSFVNCIKTFQEFWNQVSILDDCCWILDPENPTFSDISRKIKISNKVSVALTFNPYACWQIPDIKFLGCQSYVDELRETLQKNLLNEVWNTQLDILSNLVNVLEVQFPKKTDTRGDESNLFQSGDCAICFTVRMVNEIPSVICDNDNCLSNYHASCLSKYLISIPRNNVCFGRIQGKCPNCDETIVCPVPDNQCYKRSDL